MPYSRLSRVARAPRHRQLIANRRPLLVTAASHSPRRRDASARRLLVRVDVGGEPAAGGHTRRGKRPILASDVRSPRPILVSENLLRSTAKASRTRLGAPRRTFPRRLPVLRVVLRLVLRRPSLRRPSLRRTFVSSRLRLRARLVDGAKNRVGASDRLVSPRAERPRVSPRPSPPRRGTPRVSPPSRASPLWTASRGFPSPRAPRGRRDESLERTDVRGVHRVAQRRVHRERPSPDFRRAQRPVPRVPDRRGHARPTVTHRHETHERGVRGGRDVQLVRVASPPPSDFPDAFAGRRAPTIATRPRRCRRSTSRACTPA